MNISTYKGKLFSVLGDSVSTLEGYNPSDYAVYYDREHMLLANIFSPDDTWWGMVINRLNGTLLVNNSYSGSMVCKHPDCMIESYGCSDERTSSLGSKEQSPDVIMIFMGLNDWGGGMKLIDEGFEGELHTFPVAYSTMLEKLKSRYPSAEIWCIALPLSYKSNDRDFTAPRTRYGTHICEYNDTICGVAQAAGCKAINIYNPDLPYDTIDGYHPNISGMETIAKAILDGLAKQ